MTTGVRGIGAAVGPGKGECKRDRLGDARAYRLERLARQLTNTTGREHERFATRGWVSSVRYGEYVITCDPCNPLDISAAWTYLIRRKGERTSTSEIDADTVDSDGSVTVPAGNIPEAVTLISSFVARDEQADG